MNLPTNSSQGDVPSQSAAIRADAPTASPTTQQAGPQDPATTDATPAQPTAPATTVPDGTIPAATLLGVAAANGSFRTFARAVEKAGLVDALNGAGPFTVFAPTDHAFERLPPGRLDDLFAPANQAELASLLNYHIVKGRRGMADIVKWQSARTLNGQAAPVVAKDGGVTIDGAQVLFPDLRSSNGVLHGIDKVNVPVATAAAVPAASARVQ